jgi:hypothetical protein
MTRRPRRCFVGGAVQTTSATGSVSGGGELPCGFGTRLFLLLPDANQALLAADEHPAVLEGRARDAGLA